MYCKGKASRLTLKMVSSRYPSLHKPQTFLSSSILLSSYLWQTIEQAVLAKGQLLSKLTLGPHFVPANKTLLFCFLAFIPVANNINRTQRQEQEIYLASKAKGLLLGEPRKAWKTFLQLFDERRSSSKKKIRILRRRLQHSYWMEAVRPFERFKTSIGHGPNHIVIEDGQNMHNQGEAQSHSLHANTFLIHSFLPRDL